MPRRGLLCADIVALQVNTLQIGAFLEHLRKHFYADVADLIVRTVKAPDDLRSVCIDVVVLR